MSHSRIRTLKERWDEEDAEMRSELRRKRERSSYFSKQKRTEPLLPSRIS
jgi:hypothetical protein